MHLSSGHRQQISMKLSQTKQKLLDEAYNTLIQVCLFDSPLEEMAPFLAEDVMNFGAGKKELTQTKAAFLKQIKNQKELAEGLKMDFVFTPVLRKIMNEGNGAIYTDDIVNTVWVNKIKSELKFRLSFIFEYRESKWLLVHSHTSTPDPQRTDDEVWPLEELKKRTAFLEKSLEEKITELSLKNKELEIETALDKVRAGMMAMHKSDELRGVIKTIFEQLQRLDFEADASAVIIYDENYAAEHWFSGYSNETYPKSYTIPYIETFSYCTVFVEAWRDGVVYKAFPMEGKQKTDYGRWLLENTDFKDLPEEFTINVITPDRLVLNDAFNKYGMLEVLGPEELSAEKAEILKRFSKVFEQTYTRFLDLKKAEVQAREAQIEAAMERIRSRAIAMRTSDELLEVALEMRIQTDLLGQQDLEASIVHLYEKDASFFESLAAMRTPGVDGEITTYRLKFPVNATKEIEQMIKNYWSGLSEYTIEVNLKMRKKWQIVLQKYAPELFNQRFQYEENEIEEDQIEYWNFADFSGGALLTVTYSPPSPETKEFFKRSAEVFDLAYRRYKDLKKAEAQARESQIELALERVRSKTMAMHNSQDVGDTVVTLFDEVMKLGLDKSIRCGLGILEGTEQMETWSANYSPSGKVNLRTGMLNMTIHPMLVRLKKAWKSKKPGYSYEFMGEDVTKYYNALNKEPQYPFNVDLKTLPEKVFHNSFFFSSGILFAFTENPISEEAAHVLNRFANVFGQTYRRYLDLQKAEAQGHEAQIEAALERVRAKSMAMHKSEDLPETAQVLFEQFALLGNMPDRISIGIIKEEEKLIELWATDQIGSQLDHAHSGPLDEATTITKLHKAWKEGKDSVVVDLSGQRLKDWVRYIKEDMKMYIDDSHIKGRRLQQAAFFSKGMLLCTTNEPVADEIMQLLIRFAKVFDQTYTRFLDLQKAEAQAREAQIETALEKIRSSTMAMQRSEELTQVADVLFRQILELGTTGLRRCVICIFNNSASSFELWYTSEDGNSNTNSIIIPTTGDDVAKWITKSWKEKRINSKELEGTDIKEFVEFLENHGWIYPKGEKPPKYMVLSVCPFSHGILMPVTYKQLGKSELDLLQRFASVFQQTYTRFLDLQQAEERAKDAIKEASLDRVRGEIASMRSTEDLKRITPLVFNELTSLGVPFFRCGVFIIHEKEKNLEVYLSAPDGHSLGVLHLPFNVNTLTQNAVANWKKNKVYHQHWNKEDFEEWTQSMLAKGQIQDVATYQDAAAPPDSLDLHFIPFTQGMLYVGNTKELQEGDIDLVKSLADAFAIAYARYEDFTKLEKAKESIETTLTDLKQTQQQLVQSEKMASLGELTAGIAHEIQNPLNFVNNFSEVSVELIEEMHEELEKGDLKEAMALAEDVKQNLDKITHHGKRADGIVKGMLQHSRSSNGVKEPTDINALADEYLRLAYHGLRAKEKSFNATMKTDYDDSFEKVNVIPQDIGRVILNLITNAFYAVNERNKLEQKGYEQTVSVSTKKINGKVEINVTDNGNGIPKKVLAKIFQPFFTTKPTGQGTGLGLSLSYDIVKAHGGEISVKSKVGEGTAFTIELPA